MGKSFGHINCFSINSDRDCLFSDETRCIVLDHVHDFFFVLAYDQTSLDGGLSVSA
jgi:hypothetical protein